MKYFVELDDGYPHLKVGRLYPIDDHMKVRDESGDVSGLHLLHGADYLTVVVDLWCSATCPYVTK